jgi:hypothetical protein
VENRPRHNRPITQGLRAVPRAVGVFNILRARSPATATP